MNEVSKVIFIILCLLELKLLNYEERDWFFALKFSIYLIIQSRQKILLISSSRGLYIVGANAHSALAFIEMEPNPDNTRGFVCNF